MTTIEMGPVLSFRGLQGNKWQVTALIAIPLKETPPKFQREGQDCDTPVELAKDGENQILRYDLSVALKADERRVAYGFDDRSWEFTVPGKKTPPRIAYVSCNGFSEPDAVRNAKKPLFAAWKDLVENHDSKFRPADYQIDKEQIWHEEQIHAKKLQRFHVLLMGGDQIYFDSIWSEYSRLPKLSEWSEYALDDQIKFKVDAPLAEEIRAYYRQLYVERWRARRLDTWGKPAQDRSSPAALAEDRGSAAAMATMPAVMMWDDHDIFDGWGSYPAGLQYCDLFQCLFEEARRAFWIFQLQHREEDLPPPNDAVRGNPRLTKDAPALAPVTWSTETAKDPLALPLFDGQPGFNYRFNLGPIVVFVLDLRSERSKSQILGDVTWKVLRQQLEDMPDEAEHVLLMSSVPVAYPKLGVADIGLGMAGFFGIGAGSPDVLEGLADDLNDHWMHRSHTGDLNRFVSTVIDAADEHRIRFTILSGDVHLACWGTIEDKSITPETNWKLINQLTSSSIVHPPPSGISQGLFLTYVAHRAKSDTDIGNNYVVRMKPFPASDDYLQPVRNWMALELDAKNFADTNRRRLWATWRCEQPGHFTNHLHAVEPVAKKAPKKTAAKKPS